MAKGQILVAALVLVASFCTVEPSGYPPTPVIVSTPSSPPPPPPFSSPPPPLFVLKSPPPLPFFSPPPPPIYSPPYPISSPLPPPPVHRPPPPRVYHPPPPAVHHPPPPAVHHPPPPAVHHPPPPAVHHPPPPAVRHPPPPAVHHPPPPRSPPRYPPYLFLTVKPLTVRSDPGIDAKIFLTYSDAHGNRKRAGHYQLPPKGRPLLLSQEIRVSKAGPLSVEFSVRRGSQRISLTATINYWLARTIAYKTRTKNSYGDPLYSLDLKLVIKSYPKGKFFEVFSGKKLVAHRRV